MPVSPTPFLKNLPFLHGSHIPAENRVGRALGLHTAELSSIPSIPIWYPAHYQELTLSTEAGVILKKYVVPKKQIVFVILLGISGVVF